MKKLKLIREKRLMKYTLKAIWHKKTFSSLRREFQVCLVSDQARPCAAKLDREGVYRVLNIVVKDFLIYL